jgi:hypothetical protein
MTMQKGKKLISLFCILAVIIVLGLLGPLTALAESGTATGVDFSIKASLDTYALMENPDRFLKDFARTLNMLDASGHAVLQNGQADIMGKLNLNGLSAVDFHMTGWEERLSLVTSLFGEKPVVITLPNYIPFLTKMYCYFNVPVQYIGVFTDPYSYMHGIKPALEKWTELMGGTGSRSLSPEECIEKATQLSQAMDENEAFFFWRQGLLQHVNLDEILNEFFYVLPDWTSNLVQEEGLKIDASDKGESWTLGGKNIYTVKRHQGKSTWQLEIPDWEGYRLSGQGSLENTEDGLQISLNLDLYEEDALYGSLTLDGQNLPNGKVMQGAGKISVTFGGKGMGLKKAYKAGLNWNQHQDGDKTVLDGQVSVLYPSTEEPVLTVSGQISWGSTAESFQPQTFESIKGIDLFCMNDVTIKEFYANAKWPMVRSAAPFFLELPAGFLNGVVNWMDDSGILVTLMDGLARK